MERYRNLSGESGIDAYEIGADFIKVRFRTDVVYWYTETSAGAEHVEELKRLARRGRGLSTYISQHADVRDGYARKEPDD
ncbi:hypothetical protein LJ656_15590 [Paraburkholderia sp. MMS20-SJTR3]|uniref:KTSC domain-containing protein n=1 Tax=Paraburkholderia sejongensis TaxID=2886946 RepID=A0ABS8JVV9_9BURK|nr:hypothetical protein [Paraburkholderia sp. MMS20-SJTR3]MCC8394019.1 hypothetical protein [Paraburkholderia sp. MMS20-SJTR3]